MKLFISVILIYFYIFETQNYLFTNELRFKFIKELKDRRGNESVPTSLCNSLCKWFCSDLSSHARKFNKCIMQNHLQSSKTQNKPLQNGTDRSILLWFVDLYFNYLPTSRSLNEAFVKASVDYFNSYQSFKFSSFNQFKTALYGEEC